MKKLIAVLTVLCLLCASFAALAEAPATEVQPEFTFGNGIKFGMSMAEVTAIAGTPNETDNEDIKGLVTFYELEYKQVPDPMLDNTPVDTSFLFVNDMLVAIRFDLDTKSVAYEKVQAALAEATKSEGTMLDMALLGNAIYAVDDDGTPELNSLNYVDPIFNVVVVLELDKEGDDVDITILDMNAEYLTGK